MHNRHFRCDYYPVFITASFSNYNYKLEKKPMHVQHSVFHTNKLCTTCCQKFSQVIFDYIVTLHLKELYRMNISLKSNISCIRYFRLISANLCIGMHPCGCVFVSAGSLVVPEKTNCDTILNM